MPSFQRRIGIGLCAKPNARISARRPLHCLSGCAGDGLTSGLSWRNHHLARNSVLLGSSGGRSCKLRNLARHEAGGYWQKIIAWTLLGRAHRLGDRRLHIGRRLRDKDSAAVAVPGGIRGQFVSRDHTFSRGVATKRQAHEGVLSLLEGGTRGRHPDTDELCARALRNTYGAGQPCRSCTGNIHGDGRLFRISLSERGAHSVSSGGIAFDHRWRHRADARLKDPPRFSFSVLKDFLADDRTSRY